MSSYVYQAAPLSNRALLDAFVAIWKQEGGHEQDVVSAYVASVLVANCSMKDLLAQEQITKVAQSTTIRLSRVTMTVRSAGHPEWSVDWTLGDVGRADKVQVSLQNSTPSQFPRLERITKHLPHQALEAVTTSLDDQLAEFYKHREAMLARMEEIHSKSLAETDALRTRLITEHDDRVRQLEERVQSRASELEQEYAAKHEALKKREAEVDATDAKNARRRNQLNIKRLLEDRSTKFDLTAATIQKRRPIFWACVASALVSVASYALFSWETYKNGGDLRFDISRGASALAFGITIWFFIKWNNDWFAHHSNEEFRLKRMDVDIDRAAWLVELASEWDERGKGAIPAALLEHLSANLFLEPETRAPVSHPLEEAIATVVGASARAKFPLPGGGELEVEKKPNKRA